MDEENEAQWFKEHHKLGRKSGGFAFQASRAAKPLGASSVLIRLQFFCLSKAQEDKRRDGGKGDSSGGPSLCLFHPEEAVHEQLSSRAISAPSERGAGVLRL